MRWQFLNGRIATGLADLNAQAHSWLTYTANTRLHATTGQRPVDLWPQEKLSALNTVPTYQLCQRVPRQAGAAFGSSQGTSVLTFNGQPAAVGRLERYADPGGRVHVQLRRAESANGVEPA